jgi:hypothetical protein
LNIFFVLADILTAIFLIISAFYTYRIYSIIRANQILFLFWGFVLMAVSAIGILIPDSMGMTEDAIFLGKFLLAIRVVPVGFVMFGAIFLHNAICSFIEGEE